MKLKLFILLILVSGSYCVAWLTLNKAEFFIVLKTHPIGLNLLSACSLIGVFFIGYGFWSIDKSNAFPGY